MTKIFLFGLQIIFITPIFALADSECKIKELRPDQVKPVELKLLAMNPKLKRVEDLVCCLPKVYRENYIVAHSSIAGQNGIPTSPRILLYDPNDLNNVLSINGGGEAVNQGNSVEYMHHNSRLHSVEYYDIDFSSGRGRMGSKNPETCMGCHGDGSGRFEGIGARPLFESIDGEWPRFLQGSFHGATSRDILGCNSLIEAKLRAKVEAIARHSLKSNPRFRCLGDNASTPGAMDKAIEKFSQEYFAKSLGSTKDFERFKYFYLGHFAECDHGELKDLHQWLPDSEIENLNKLDSVNPIIRAAKSAREACLKMASESLKFQTEIEKIQKAQLDKDPKDFNGPMALDETPFLCSYKRSPDQLCAQFSETPNFSNEERFKLDTFFKPSRRNVPILGPTLAGPRKEFDSRIRYIIEANGGDASLFSMSPSGGAYQRGANLSLSDSLLKELKARGWAFRGSKIFVKDLNSFENAPQSAVRSMAQNEKISLCKELAQKSLLALQSGATDVNKSGDPSATE